MLAAGYLFVALLPVQSAESPDTDIARLQGFWEMRVRQNGVELRIVKEVVDRKETVTVYRGTEVVHSHHVDFEITFTGDVRIFRWRNGMDTAGPNKGKPKADGRFIYRLEDDRWTGIFGALEGETRPVYVEQYRRIPPP